MALALLERHQYESETWIQEYYDSLPELEFGRKTDLDALRDAYLFGKRFSQNAQGPYEAEEQLMMKVWDDLICPDTFPWKDAQPVIEHAFNHHRAEAWASV
jgi:hypothetical protein